MLATLKQKLEGEMDKGLVSTNILIGRFTMLGEDTRLTPAYIDPRNFPFYYYLGKHVAPKNVLEIGFDLGFRTGCFLQSCKSVEKFLAIEGRKTKNDYYNARLGIKNIKSVYKGKFDLKVAPVQQIMTMITDPVDLAIVNEEMSYDNYRNVFDAIFEVLSLDGLLVVGFIADKTKEAFAASVEIHNREYLTLNTRYGTGIVKK